MNAIVDKLSEAYGKKITLTRKYYANSVLVVDAVLSSKEVDMSEPYYYLSGFAANEPRIEAMGFSCVTAGTPSAFYVNNGSGISNMDELISAINKGSNLIGFIGQVCVLRLTSRGLPCS
jgi:purine nucleoside permease